MKAFVLPHFKDRVACVGLSLTLAVTAPSVFSAAALPLADDHADRIAPISLEELAAARTPDVAEASAAGPGSNPVETALLAGFGSSVQQRAGALSGKIVFMNSGHGWTFDPTYWRLQRPTLLEMNEDYGNLDQLNFFAQYCFNAGATVVSMRPLGHQTNEVILDNDDPAVTYSGAWSDSVQTNFWGNPGDVPYRFASLSATETATATYTPNIPVAGFYPVYTWVLAGSDRGDQLYRIRHTGGESLVRIPHHMVGNGWIYLGEYYFNAGASSTGGAVVVSNLRSSPQGTVVIADAIRFGNGMGSVDRGGGVSGYPREDENMRYWLQGNLAQGQSTLLYDGTGNDEQDSWSAPPKMSAYMNRETAGTFFDRVHISFHSNAGGGRGVVGLITSNPTPYQTNLAYLCGKEVNDDLVALGAPPLETAWADNGNNVTFSGGYGEISNGGFVDEMAATIIEVAFHDNANDALLLRDPKARAAVARAAMQGVIKFFHQYDTNNPPPLAFLPEAPTNLRASAALSGNISLAWTAPVSSGGSQSPTNYVLYRSTDGYGFGNPVSVGNVTGFTLSNLVAGVDYYFRVTAVNAGGESMPSETVGCRDAVTNNAPRVLVVNAFDRFDRSANLRQDVVGQSWDPPGNSGAIERVYPRWNNAFDYVVAHGKALAAAGWAFDSCQNEAVANDLVSLANYAIVIWACGNESTGDETFSATEQARVSTYLAAGGALFASGADIAYDLDRPTGPTTADRNFAHNYLHLSYGTNDSATYATTVTGGGIFAGRAGAGFDNGNSGIYRVSAPDVLVPAGAAVAALNYSGGGSVAAIQYDGAIGNGRVVVLGFPFETITSSVRRNEYLLDILNFLHQPSSSNVPPVIFAPPLGGVVVTGSNATLSVSAGGSPPLAYQWRFNGVDLVGATSANYTRLSAQPAHSGYYEVVVSNAWGTVESEPALLEVMLPPLQTIFSDTFDANTAGNWLVNSSSTDTRVTFNYDYAADGIASSPHSSAGTTRGVKFEANLANGIPAALNISPVGRSFTGDYQLHFDMWLNANGPFPGGGVGSTEHFTAGIGSPGNQVHWTGSGGATSGTWFVVDGEGGSTDTTTTSLPDYGAISGTAIYAANSGVYAAGTTSDARGNGNGYYTTAFPGRTAPSLQQSNYPQQTGTIAAGSAGFAWHDVIISKTGPTVAWSIDGLRLATISNASFSANNIFVGYWDSYASVSDNPNLSFGLADNIRIETFITNIPPYVLTQPASVTAPVGSDVGFSLTAGGTAPLAYQWRLNGTNIPGATSSSFARVNAQAWHAGNYSAVVTNSSGSVTSAVAMLSLTPSGPLRFDGITALPAGRLLLEVSGDAGFMVQLQTSTNLVDWSVLTNLPNPTGALFFTNDPPAGGPYQFYRAQY